MSDSSKRAKPASVAAFLFLPQFGQMFRSSSYLVPVFIRTVASLFVQAKLLPPTHPAFNYGAPGVEKCGFIRMMGDAWYTLRSTSASTYQWSVFSSVLLMIFILISSVIMTVINFSVIFISSAAAQVYSSPPSLGPTDIASIPTLVSPCNSSTPFCRIIPAINTAHSDYAINILDSMLRRGTVPGDYAGPIQTAMGGLMEVYNAGILVVAGLLLFWLIISVVVDIAKTGQIGGGRHNLVWAPIRIVFALGMMIPFGTTGYSGGQFAVMKVAEWGSNFGSNGWDAYLAIIAKSSATLPDLPLGSDLMPLVGAYERMWICRVAHNGYGFQAEGAAFVNQVSNGFPTQEVVLHPDTKTTDKGEMSYAYTNNTANDLCGRLTFPTGMAPALQSLFHPPANTIPDPVALASATFKYNMDQAWMSVFVGGYNPTSGNPNPNPKTMTDKNLPLAKLGNEFACGFVAQHIWGTVAGADVLSLDCGGGSVTGASAAPICGSGGGGSGQYPDVTTCVDNATKDPNFDTNTMTGLIANKIYSTAQAQQNGLQQLTQQSLYGQRGWADMGGFYKAISTLTMTVRGSLEIPVQVTAPGIQDTSDNQSAKVQEVLGKFDDWWNTVPNTEAPATVSLVCQQNPPPPNINCPVIQHGGGLFNPFSLVKAAVGGVTGAVGTVVHAGEEAISIAKLAIGAAAGLVSDPSGEILKLISHTISDYSGTSFLAIPAPNDPNHYKDYPLQLLTNAGGVLLKISFTMYTLITGIEVAAALVPTLSMGATIATSMLGHLMQVIADILLSCGFILVYYLPVLPFIRVTHAVLTWMVAVFEAVMLVPIACLAFLDTEKEGMYNKLPFVNWLDILVRPILTVIGFVGSILVFDTFFAFFQDSFANATASEVAGTSVLHHFFAMFANSVLFTLIMYTAANTCFKLMTTIPNAFFRWLPGGQAGAFQDDGGDHSGAVGKIGGAASQLGSKASGAENRTRKGIRGYESDDDREQREREEEKQRHIGITKS